MEKQKKALVMQDISCIGRISTMVALPILVSSGINTSIIPTALLSTHTQAKDYFFKDLSDEMTKIINNYKKLNYKFDAIQTGYLGNENQIKIVKEAFSLSHKDTIFIVDPAMADNGKLYKGINNNMIEAMKELCEGANIIIPNLTEAHFLLGRNHQDKSKDKEYLKELSKSLATKFKNNYVIITGVSEKENHYGSMCFDVKNDEIYFAQREYIDKSYFGTGDIFTSVITSAILNQKSIFESCEIATNFTQSCVKKSFDIKLEKEEGVCFEQNIPNLIKQLKS